MLERLKRELSSGRLAHYFVTQGDEEKFWLKDAHLLTDKPVMYICNVREGEQDEDAPLIRRVKEIAAKEGARVLAISAAVEAEVAELPERDRASFLSGLGLRESGLSRLIREGYSLLGLITFFTAGPKEVRAWTVKNGTTAQKGAGVIHSDFEKGFIRAEIMKFGDLDRYGSETPLREKGLIRVEGKDYMIEDGDVVFVRFNV